MTMSQSDDPIVVADVGSEIDCKPFEQYLRNINLYITSWICSHKYKPRKWIRFVRIKGIDTCAE